MTYPHPMDDTTGFSDETAEEYFRFRVKNETELRFRWMLSRLVEQCRKNQREIEEAIKEVNECLAKLGGDHVA